MELRVKLSEETYRTGLAEGWLWCNISNASVSLNHGNDLGAALH